jgi:hypothetical protein
LRRSVHLLFDAGSVATRRQPSRLVDAHQLLGVTHRAIPSCCRGFVCYVCAFITRAQRAGISDTCDAASGRCCVQTTPAAAAFGGTLAGWPPPHSRLFGEEASKLGGRVSVQVPFPQSFGVALEPMPANRAGPPLGGVSSKSLYGATERRETPFRWAARSRLPKRRLNPCNPPRNAAGRSAGSTRNASAVMASGIAWHAAGGAVAQV